MSNMYANAVLDEMQDTLQHYGIFGMHWGIRRYQPYGEGGYDPDHEGKNIGLAARLAGHTGSYSDAIKRGSSFGNRAKAAASSFGKRAEKAINEAADRANYATERAAQGLKNAGNRAKSGLAKYAGGKYDSDAARIYEGASAKDLAKGVFSRFSSDAKTKVSDLRRTSFDDVKSALGSGASSFQEAMQRTAVKSKDFARNAALTASLLGGAFDSKSNASQTMQTRSYEQSFPDKRTRAWTREDKPVWNPGTYAARVNGGRAEDIHGDALDLAGRMIGNKYPSITKTGKAILSNPDNTRKSYNIGKLDWDPKTGFSQTSESWAKADHPDKSNLGSGWLGSKRASDIRAAGKKLTPDDSAMPWEKRAALTGGKISSLSPISQTSTAPRWKGNDAPNLEARKRVYTGELQNLDSRGKSGSQSIVDARIQKPYKGYDRVTPKEWEYKDMLYKHRRDTAWSPDMPSKYGSKTGNMTNDEFLKRLRGTGNKIAPINQVAERRKTRPIEYGKSGLTDKGSNSGIPREDVDIENVVDFRNRKMPHLVSTQNQLNRELKKRGVSFAMINQTPVPMIPKGQNTESVEALIKRLGIGTI